MFREIASGTISELERTMGCMYAVGTDLLTADETVADDFKVVYTTGTERLGWWRCN
jgi:hypothetical protein